MITALIIIPIVASQILLIGEIHVAQIFTKAVVLMILVNTGFNCKVGVMFIVYCVSFVFLSNSERLSKHFRTAPRFWMTLLST